MSLNGRIVSFLCFTYWNRLSKCPSFFPGLLCHLKIPVWREIHQWKIPPGTWWTNRRVSSRHSVCQSFSPREFVMWFKTIQESRLRDIVARSVAARPRWSSLCSLLRTYAWATYGKIILYISNGTATPFARTWLPETNRDKWLNEKRLLFYWWQRVSTLKVYFLL